MTLICQTDQRRNTVRVGCYNGIDYAELLLDEQGAVQLDAEGRPTLRVAFLGKLTPEQGEPFTKEHLRIEGGRRVANLRVVELRFIRARDAERDDLAELVLDRLGDQSPYTLRLLADSPGGIGPLADYDPRYLSVGFSFTPSGPVEVDCVVPVDCPDTHIPPPELSYLAKDYASFRQLLLDRLATTLPGWRERHAADLYLTLVELLAHAGDQLSYYQDAVATEAYLDTARLRTSVRRHVRLVDYPMHEGCNARAFVHVAVLGDPEVLATGLAFITRPEGFDLPDVLLLPDVLRELPPASYELFEPLVERGPQAISQADIRRPRQLARRLRDERGGFIAALRSRLSEGTIALLALADGSAEDLPHLIAALAAELNRLLDDPSLALHGRGATAEVVERYGTLNALRDECLCRHNYRRLHEQLPDELAPPASLVFHEAHNTILLYTWELSECCLARGSTSATLLDGWADEAQTRRKLRYLRPGDLLLFEEVLGPRTGSAAGADFSHRHGVRLTGVNPGSDPLNGTLVVEIAWAEADALPFALCLSTQRPAPYCDLLRDVSVARGNLVLVDHGETVRSPEPLALRDDGQIVIAVPFPPPDDRVPPGPELARCIGEKQFEQRWLPGQYTPILSRGPLLFTNPLPSIPPPASQAIQQQPQRSLPSVSLFTPLARPHPRIDALRPLLNQPHEQLHYARWQPQRDLLASSSEDYHFTTEIADDGRAQLRFAEDAPLPPGAQPFVSYRVGGGLAGNVGVGAIAGAVLHGELRGGYIVGVRNPLAALGGTAPEPLAEVRIKAPHAFRHQLQRAVVAEDYAAIVERDFSGHVQRAAATLTRKLTRKLRVQINVVVAIDPRNGRAEPGLRRSIRRHLERYRRIGHRLAVYFVDTVGINLHLKITLLPHYQRGALMAALRERFSNRELSGGALGFFHPDRWLPGQAVAVSQIVAAAMTVEGVVDASVTRLDRRGLPVEVIPSNGLLVMRPRQVAQLDNDPDNQEHGVLRITLEGGR